MAGVADIVEVLNIQDVAGLGDMCVRGHLGPGYEMACHGVCQPQEGDDEQVIRGTLGRLLFGRRVGGRTFEQFGQEAEHDLFLFNAVIK